MEVAAIFFINLPAFDAYPVIRCCRLFDSIYAQPVSDQAIIPIAKTARAETHVTTLVWADETNTHARI